MSERTESAKNSRLLNTELTDKQRRHLISHYGTSTEALKVFINARLSWIQSDGNLLDAFGGA